MSSKNHTKYKVSVCIVTYNHELYIKDCLLSVLTQRFDTNIEILVGDDASTDGTSRIIQTISDLHPELIKVFHHETNLGPSGNYQYLLERASGEFIAPLDGDDFWMPGKLESQLNFLNKYPDCVAVYSNALVIGREKELFGVFNNSQPDIFDTNYLLKNGNFLNQSSLLYRSSLKYDLLKNVTQFFDFQINLCLSLYGKLGYVNQALVVYRYGHKTSLVTGSLDEVRNMHWNTLQNFKTKSTQFFQINGALESFWAEILIHSLLNQDYRCVLRWAKRIHNEKSVSKSRVFIFGSLYGITILMDMVINKVCYWISGNKLRVLCKR